MAQVVQAKCPGCKKVLRIPATWVNQAIRCKHCGTILQARPKGTPPATAEPAARSEPAPGPRQNPPAPGAGAKPKPPAVGTRREPPPARPVENPFAPPDDGPIIRTPQRRHARRSGARRLLTAVGAVILLAGAGYFLWQRLLTLGWVEKLSSGTTVVDRGAAADPTPGAIDTSRLRAASGPLPRRALGICVSNYLYANPVGYGDGNQRFHTFLERLAGRLRIPPDQVVQLSDGGTEAGMKPPLKAVIERAVTEFLDTSRPQDRILLVFAGHAVEVGDEAFLVPLEGELTVKETLISLAWLYDRLAQCKARQKVLVLDVCRYDPGRGKERPGAEPMGARLDAALTKPPDGVQVWSACVAGQNSFEFDGKGVFLDKLAEALETQRGSPPPEPDDPLPVELLARDVNRATEEEAGAQQAKQTPRLAGQEKAGETPYDPGEPPPPKLVLQTPAPPGGTAGASAVKEILAEINVPPIRQGQAATSSFKIETLSAFSAKALEPYRPDYNSLAQLKAEIKARSGEASRYPVREAVLGAVGALDKSARTVKLRETFSGGTSEKIKADVRKIQEVPARALLELDETLEKLRKVGADRDKETRRWQANYDYVLAQVLARMAYIHEYNLMLGKIRKDELPKLEKHHTSYRLSSREKLQSGKEVRDMAAESRKLLTRLTKEHPGTPWEVLAKRDRLTALGLEWQPTR